MRCTRCAFDNPAGMRFCGECGADLPAGPVAVRPAPEPEPAPNLEQPIAGVEAALPAAVRPPPLDLPEGETRPVTLLFADMTGSVATTAGLDPEDAAHLVNRLLNTMVAAITLHGRGAPSTASPIGSGSRRRGGRGANCGSAPPR